VNYKGHFSYLSQCLENVPRILHIHIVVRAFSFCGNHF